MKKKNSLFKQFTGLCILFMLSVSVYGQSSIKGTVTSSDYQGPIPGVNILVKGTQTGTATDFDGNYSINASKGDVLVFSYIGYKTLEVLVTNQTTLNIQLEPDLSQLDEVVVIGYGTANKKDLTGSVGIVDVEDLQKAPVITFDQALAGRVAGIQVTSPGGAPGSSQKIVIRGVNSINGNSNPLWVLDGFIYEDFDPSSIDPSDIETINVLKDASATAIYGARGSNGVIIITSKQPKSGKTRVSLEARTDISHVINKLDVLDAYEYVKLGAEVNEGRATDIYLTEPDENGNSVLVPGASFEDYRNVQGRDWQDEAFRTAITNTYRLKINGGKEDTRYRASINSVKQEGTLIKSLYERIDGRFVLNHKINEKLDATIDVNYQNYVQNGLNVTGDGSYSFLRSLLGYRPVANIYRDFGVFNPLEEVNEELGDFTNIVVWHPIVSLNNEFDRTENDRMNVNLGLKYKITPELTFETKFNYRRFFRIRERFNNSKTVYGRLINPVNGINGSVQRATNKNFLTVNTLKYKKKFKDHSIDALLGVTFNEQNAVNSSISGIFIPSYVQHLGINSIDFAEQLNTSNDQHNKGKNRIFSLLGRLNYSYKGKYLFTSSVRRDASSRFTDTNRAAVLPSAAISWRADKEKFIENLNIFSQLKFKVGYGKTGNDRIPNDARFNVLTGGSGGIVYFFNNQTVPGQIPTATAGNPNIQWEVTEQVNAGANFGFLKDRVDLEVEAYRKDTKDLLLRADIAPSQGASSRWINAGQVRNTGLEFTLNTVNVETEDFRWQSSFNISFNQNEVVWLPEDQTIFARPNYYQRLRTNQFIVTAGQALGNMYGYISDGVYQPEDFENYDPTASTNTLAQGQPSYRGAHQPGDEKYKDINGDGAITQADKTIIGNGYAKHYGGFNNTFNYKNFSLSAFFQWSYGNDILNANKLVLANLDGGWNQLAEEALNRWTPDNQNTTIHRAAGQGFEDISSRIVEDGSYLRLKTVNMSYAFPKERLDRFGLSSLEFSLSAHNLITWTDYSGYDPEVSVRDTAITPGIDYSSYPNSSTYSFGIKLSF